MNNPDKSVLIFIFVISQFLCSCKKENNDPDPDPVTNYEIHNLVLYNLEHLGDYGMFSNSIKCSTGGYLLTGHVYHYSAYLWHNIRINENGDILWARDFTDTTGGMAGLTSIETSDHKYILAGSDFGLNENAILVIKMDDNGNTLWKKNYLGSLNSNAHNQIAETIDGNILIAGTQTVSSVHKGYILKISSEGDSLWSTTFEHAPGHVKLCSIIATDDGGFAAIGQIGLYASKNTLIFYKWDSSGNLEWSKEFGEKMYNYAEELYEDADGNYYILASSDQANEDMTYSLLIKTDQTGNFLFSKYFTTKKYDKLYPADLTILNNGSLMMTIPKDGPVGTLFIFTDLNGNEIKREYIETINAYKTIEVSSGRFAVFGEYYITNFFYGLLY